MYVYQFIRANGGWDNWDMVELERYNATDKRDLHTRERYWIETLGAALNKIIPTRTKQEYNKEYREENKEKMKEYCEKNKVKISTQRKQRRANQFAKNLHLYIHS